MLGVQVPRSLPDPTLPLSPPSRVFDRRLPSSRERLGLRSLAYPSRSPPSRPGSRSRQQQETEGNRAMSGSSYGSLQQPLSQYASGTYGSAMSGISSQRSNVNQGSNWSSFPPSTGYQSSQTNLPASQGQSRAASPEFETQPAYGSDGYGYSKSGSNNSIHPYLQLPPTITPSGGSISEFSAQV